MIPNRSPISATVLIFWDNGSLTHVSDKIAEVYEEYGGPRGTLGVPLTGEYDITPDMTATGQYFDNGCIYATKFGVYTVHQPIFGRYDPYGSEETGIGAIKQLGLPVAKADVDKLGISQRFEHGMLCSSAHGIFPVRAEVVEITLDEWPLIFPASEEVDAVPSRLGAGTLQHFRDLGTGDPVMVYSSDKGGVHAVEGQFLLTHDRLDGTGGWLGFPVSGGGFDTPETGWQEFEGGIVYVRRPGSGFAVSNKTLNFITAMRAEAELGWPVSEEYALGDGVDGVQFFENGAFARRNGKLELLARRAKPAAPQGEEPAIRKVTAADLRARKAGRGGPVLIPSPPTAGENPEVPHRTGPAVPRSVPRAVPPAVPKASEAGTLGGAEEDQPPKQGRGTFPR